MNLINPQQHLASNYPRRILLAVCGISPQIITETLYALACKTTSLNPFVPTEIHVITTTTGANRAKLALLSDEPGWFHRLCDEYNLKGIDFGEANIHVITDASGRQLEDIRSIADNEIAADFITEKLRLFTADAQSAIHVSLAGGRKTMGFYLGYALSLFGRPQDDLSHVLVSEPYESCLDFFYPSKANRVIQTKNGELADCKNAIVTLARIPVVRLRAGLPKQLLSGHVSFVQSVAAAQEAFAEPSLLINLPQRTIVAGGSTLKPTPMQLALICVFARRVLNVQSPLSAPTKDVPDRDWGSMLLRELRFMNLTDNVLIKLETSLAKGIDGNNFSTQKCKLELFLRTNLGNKHVHYLLDGGSSRPRQYKLVLQPAYVKIISGSE